MVEINFIEFLKAERDAFLKEITISMKRHK